MPSSSRVSFIENYAWLPEVLKEHLGHIGPASRCPADKIETLNRSRTFLAGLAMVRQLEFALFDFRLHRATAAAAGERTSCSMKCAARKSRSLCRRLTTAFRTRSRTSSAAVTRPAITATSGPKCSPPMRSPHSCEAGVFDRDTRNAFGARSWPSAAAARRSRRSSSSAAARPRWSRCCASPASTRSASAMAAKIATWNVNSLRVRFGAGLDWLAAEQPDVLALQETKTKDEDFPVESLRPSATARRSAGRPDTTVSRCFPRAAAADVSTEIAGFPDPQRRVLAATFADLRIIDLYVPNGQSVDSDKLRYKLDWLAAIRAELARELERHPIASCLATSISRPRIATCMIRMPGPARCCAATPERAALRAILELGFDDCFRLFEQAPASLQLVGLPRRCIPAQPGPAHRLDPREHRAAPAVRALPDRREPRRAAQPSDHAPVIAEFADA
jgi:exodeoxyribonuclease III